MRGLCSPQSFKDPGPFQPVTLSSPRTPELPALPSVSGQLLVPRGKGAPPVVSVAQAWRWRISLHPTERLGNMALLYVYKEIKDFGGHVAASTTACISAGGLWRHHEVG